MSELFEQAVNLANSGETEKAISAYKELLAVAPDDFRAWTNLGMLLAPNHPDDALRALNEANTLQPRHPIILFNLASVQHKQRRYAQAIDNWKQLLETSPENWDGWFNLALSHAANQAPEEAIATYRHIIDNEPGYYEAFTNLSLLYFKQAQYLESLQASMHAIELKDLAIDYYQLAMTCERVGDLENATKHYVTAFRKNPENTGPLLAAASLMARRSQRQEAIDLLSSFTGEDIEVQTMLRIYRGEAPDALPENYISELFDRFSSTFDERLEQLGYRTPATLAAQTLEYLSTHALSPSRILDAGCGTGLLGLHLRDAAEELMGVDLSSGMLERANERGVYDKLVNGDLIECLNEHSFDLIAASDVFNYFGDLRPVLAACGRSLGLNGVIAFSIESDNRHASFHLNDTGRYSHEPAYVQALLEQTGFTNIQRIETVLRYEQNQPVDGALFVALIGQSNE